METVRDGPGRAARVSPGKSGWKVAAIFDLICKFLLQALPLPLACRFATL